MEFWKNYGGVTSCSGGLEVLGPGGDELIQWGVSFSGGGVETPLHTMEGYLGKFQESLERQHDFCPQDGWCKFWNNPEDYTNSGRLSVFVDELKSYAWFDNPGKGSNCDVIREISILLILNEPLCYIYQWKRHFVVINNIVVSERKKCTFLEKNGIKDMEVDIM